MRTLSFSLWLFEKFKTHQYIDFVDDFEIGAGEGNRTLVCSLEDCRSTIELRPPALRFGAARPKTCAAKS
jgi:hypothetical protein